MSSLHAIAPRLAQARDQMIDTERVLGWIRDNGWTGGVDVLVPVDNYMLNREHRWIGVDRIVQGDASPYPIRGYIKIGGIKPTRISGQWTFWEVDSICFWSDDFPELLYMHPQFPRPRDRPFVFDERMLDFAKVEDIRLLATAGQWHPHPYPTLNEEN